MQYKYVEAHSLTNESAIIRMDGTFGVEIDGPRIASEINFLDNVVGVKEIHLHINSPGGVVFDSFSIVSAILTAKATIHGHNDGICMSSAFHTFISCKVLHAFEFGQFMFHGPSISSDSDDDISETTKQFLKSIRDGMVTLIASRLDKTKDAVDKMLDKETFFNASNFEKTLGLPEGTLDIKPSGDNPTITSDMSFEQVVAELTKFTNINLNRQEMPENTLDITSVLSLCDLNANVANPVDKIEAKVKAILASNTALEEANDALTKDLATHKAADEARSKVEAEAYIDEQITAKRVKKESRESTIDAYVANPEGVKAIFDSMPAPSAKDQIISSKLDRDGDDGKMSIETFKNKKGETVLKDFEWMSKNASAELKEIQDANPAYFEFLIDNINAK